MVMLEGGAVVVVVVLADPFLHFLGGLRRSGRVVVCCCGSDSLAGWKTALAASDAPSFAVADFAALAAVIMSRVVGTAEAVFGGVLLSTVVVVVGPVVVLGAAGWSFRSTVLSTLLVASPPRG